MAEYGYKDVIQKGNFDKNGGKGYDRGKGKCRSFSDDCWRCGKVEQRQDQCRVRIKYVGEENHGNNDDDRGEAAIGGLWHIASIEEESEECVDGGPGGSTKNEYS